MFGEKKDLPHVANQYEVFPFQAFDQNTLFDVSVSRR